MRPSFKLLLAGCLLPLSCLAQPLDTPPPLDLATAETLLLEANPAILQARSAVAGARAGMDIAGARPNPTLSAAVTSINPARNSNGGYWDRPMDSVLRVDQTFERGDKRELRLRAADRNLAATGADLANTIRLARMALANAWLNLRAAQEIRQIAAESARLAARAADAAELRGKAGDLAGVDVARFAADAARVANDAVQADLDYARARLELSLLLGNRVAPDTLQAAAEWPDSGLPANDDGERPDLLAARQRLALADAQRDLARAQRTRDVSVGVQYEHFPPDARNTYGISVSIPLFLGNDYRGDIARSEAEYTAAEQQLDATRAAAGRSHPGRMQVLDTLAGYRPRSSIPSKSEWADDAFVEASGPPNGSLAMPERSSSASSARTGADSAAPTSATCSSNASLRSTRSSTAAATASSSSATRPSGARRRPSRPQTPTSRRRRSTSRCSKAAAWSCWTPAPLPTGARSTCPARCLRRSTTTPPRFAGCPTTAPRSWCTAAARTWRLTAWRTRCAGWGTRRWRSSRRGFGSGGTRGTRW